MSSAFHGIHISASALGAHQRALEVTAHNITNVNTPGYHRQVVSYQAALPTREVSNENAEGAAYFIGGGVEIADVRRVHASYLDRQTHLALADLGSASARAQLYQRIESTLSEPADQGLAIQMERFFNAFEALAARPADRTARQEVVLAGQQLADSFNRVGKSLLQQQLDAEAEARLAVQRINDLAQRVAGLSREIRRAIGVGTQPNDLLDERDRYLTELAERAGVQIYNQEQGEVVVSLAGLTLVHGEQAATLELATTGSGIAVLNAATGESVTPGGQLGALVEVVNQDLPLRRDQIAELRDALVAAVNQQHAAGVDAQGNPGGAFFAMDGGRLVVDPLLVADPMRLAAAAQNAPGDGQNARALAALRDATFVNGMTPGAAFRTLVVETGLEVRAGNERQEQAEAVVEHFQQLAAAEAGVSLDEELMNMVSLQHAYAAAARMLTAFDEMLGILIEQTGVVGR